MLTLFVSLALSMILIIINNSINKKMFKEREKLTPFECGFDPSSSARLPFSMQFFLIAIIFLIFDIEITLILPIPILNFSMNTFTLLTIFTIFVVILILGLFYEWMNGALEWM